MIVRWTRGALAVCWLSAVGAWAHPPPPSSGLVLKRPDVSYWYGVPAWDPYWPTYPSAWYPLPPLFLPAETLYGPEAMKRFLGVGGVPALPVVPPTGGLPGAPVPADERKPEPVLRATNASTRDLAWRFIAFGDQHFKNGKFGDAYQRYRKAAEVMPDLAEAQFRQGIALIASGRYELAAKALRRGLSLDSAWPRSGFRLGDLYQANEQAKAAHVEALAAAAEKDAENPDLFFLLGAALYFDGAPQRALPFFERAAQRSGEGVELRAFLDVLRGEK